LKASESIQKVVQVEFLQLVGSYAVEIIHTPEFQFMHYFLSHSLKEAIHFLLREIPEKVSRETFKSPGEPVYSRKYPLKQLRYRVVIMS